MKFGILWLFSLTLVTGILLAVATSSLQWAFLLSCVSLGSFVGLAVRLQFRSSHTTAVFAVFITSTIVGAMLLAGGSYFHTFIEPSVGFLVGDGWRSVGASFIVGSIVGAITSLFAVLMYAAASGMSEILATDQTE